MNKMISAKNAPAAVGPYSHAVLAGNALATHDLEAAYLNTALGQNIYTQESQPNGHYNHLDTINRVRACGSPADVITGPLLSELYGLPVEVSSLHNDRARACVPACELGTVPNSHKSFM